MIKSLSPYYINIPFVSPLSSLTCTAYTLQVFVWNGAKNTPPITPSYEFTKPNPTASTGNDIVDIANVVNDFINFNPSANDSTDLLNGNNQNWIRIQTFYETADPLDATTATNISVELMVKGYSYGMNGANQSTPTNKILLSGTEFKVNRDGTFVLPILTDDSDTLINAVNDTANIFFQDTLIDVLINDNLGFTPTNIISVTTSMPSSVGTFTIESNKVKFNKGVGTLATPQTCSYTIEDSTGDRSTAVLTINISEVPALPDAQNETFAVNDFDVIDLDVLNNDALGTAPTTIVSFDDSGLTCGDITNNTTDLTFTPNGVFSVSETFTYTIEDSLANQSTATVTLNVSHLPGDVYSAFRSRDNEDEFTCGFSTTISIFVEPQTVGILTDGDLIYSSDMTLFNGGNLYYKINYGTLNASCQISSTGVLNLISLCL